MKLLPIAANLVLFAVFFVTFEYQYMWYPTEEEARLLRSVEVISIVGAGLLCASGKYLLTYLVILTSFCAPFFFVHTAFSWALFTLLFLSLFMHAAVIRILNDLNTQSG